jgi:hypothetical protein
VGILFLLPAREIAPPQTEPPGAPESLSVAASSTSGDFSPSVPAAGPVTLVASPAAADWEDRLDNILSADGDDRAAVRQLLEGLPGLPLEAQEEYVSHALNLCDDDDYGQIETVFLAVGTPAKVSEGIFDDVLNRPDEVKLPLLAKTLRNPTHPMAEEAREILEMYLDLDEGTLPPAGWEAAVRQYLAENRDE